MTKIATVYAVFADADEAERVATAMIAAELAACVNILGVCHSLYRWEDALETKNEVPALFKTSADKVDLLVAAIAAMHSYDVPAIVAWPIVQVGPGYAEWVTSGQVLG